MEWEMVGHIAFDTLHALKNKATIDGIEVIQETITKRNKASGKFGKPKHWYYVENRPEIFKTLDELLKHLKTLDK